MVEAGVAFNRKPTVLMISVPLRSASLEVAITENSSGPCSLPGVTYHGVEPQWSNRVALPLRTFYQKRYSSLKPEEEPVEKVTVSTPTILDPDITTIAQRRIHPIFVSYLIATN